MLHNQGPNLLFSELSKDELAVAKEHVEITRHLQEIHQLYLMFQYALDSFDAKYLLMSDGKVCTIINLRIDRAAACTSGIIW